MNELKNDLRLSLLLTVAFAITLWMLVPFGIDVPETTHDPGQLSPAAYPTWISTAGLCTSLLMTISALVRMSKKTNLTKNEAPKPFVLSEYLVPTSAFLLLFAFYFLIDILGMVIGGFILYAAFAVLCGERKWIRLLIVDSILIFVVYFFFVKVATVPIPLGILENVLY